MDNKIYSITVTQTLRRAALNRRLPLWLRVMFGNLMIYTLLRQLKG
jgi:hypothetical protein